MAVNLITFSGQNVLPEYDAEARKGMTGFTTMPAVTLSGSNLIHLTECYGMIAGYQFHIDATDVPLALPASGSVSGALYLHLDISDIDEPLTLIAGETPTYVYGNGVYDMEIAQFTATPSGASNVTLTAPNVDDPMILKRNYTYDYGQVVRCPSCKPGLMLRSTTAAPLSGTAKVEPVGMRNLWNDGDTITDGGITWRAFNLQAPSAMVRASVNAALGGTTGIFTAPENGDYLIVLCFRFASSIHGAIALNDNNEVIEANNVEAICAATMWHTSAGNTFKVTVNAIPASTAAYTIYYKYKKL